MRTFLKKETGKHLKWIIVLLLLSVIYATLGINGQNVFQQKNDAASLQKGSYSVDGNKINIEIPAQQHILLQVRNLPQKQETVTVSFYNKQKELIDSRDIILCNGINDLGKYKDDIYFLKYSSTKTIDIENVFHADRIPADITAALKTGMGIFFLCCIQYFLTMVKRKYAG